MAASAEVGIGMKLAWVLLLGSVSLCAETFFVTVAGIGGDPEYDKRFESWAGEAAKALPKSETLRAATREALRAAVNTVAARATADDEFVLTLIGHGTFDGVDYKLNLQGPDISARELAALLEKVPAARQLVVNTTSASGASLEALRKPGRIVITATKSGTEKNATQFARHWVEALRDPAADSDKNEAVSALEAFRYAERKTQAWYAGNGNIATEHPRMEGEGGAFVLARFGQTASAYTDPAKRDLLGRREHLELQIEELKLRKAAMPSDEYKKRLTALLLDLARTQQELDK
jgi:hypothetical protein